MTTCNYCNCAINERDAAPDGRSVHADYFKCMAALRHRVAFLESELGAERSLFADIVSDLQTKVESLTAELGNWVRCVTALKRYVAELEVQLKATQEIDYAASPFDDRLERYQPAED